jgi:hypothetical protein
MATKTYVDKTGLLYFWGRVKEWVTGKIPTKTSQLENDSRFITASDVPDGATASTTLPKADGTAAVGVETAFARGDHVHPSDTTKVDKVTGKGLSSNDYTTAEKEKLSGIAAGATKTELCTDISKNASSDTYAATPKAVAAYVASMVSGVYKPSGSLDMSVLPPPGLSVLGCVYNATTDFTTTDKFVEGAGKAYPAGTNVVCVCINTVYLWDVLAGFIDLSKYVAADDLTPIPDSEIEAIVV